MIKPLPYYVIPEMFLLNIGYDDPWYYIDTSDIMSDFLDLLESIGILYQVDLDNDSTWSEESELIDMEISIDQPYKNCMGKFYITWYKDNWLCKNIWYSGNTDDDEQVYETWENK